MKMGYGMKKTAKKAPVAAKKPAVKKPAAGKKKK